MELHIGDLVKIRSWKDMEKEFGLTASGHINMPILSFVEGMKPICGMIGRIQHIHTEHDASGRPIRVLRLADNPVLFRKLGFCRISEFMVKKIKDIG